MKLWKIGVGVIVGYVGIVVAFESLIGFLQPADASTILITTFGAEGEAHDRIVSRLEVDDAVYVAANHWPRAWYHRALEQPDVRITVAGATRDVRAVAVTGEEHARVDRQKPLPLPIRFLTGFPPRYFLRLDPR